jgi:cytochrome c
LPWSKSPALVSGDYKWPYPGIDEIRPKTSYIATNDDGLYCGVGAYK